MGHWTQVQGPKLSGDPGVVQLFEVTVNVYLRNSIIRLQRDMKRPNKSTTKRNRTEKGHKIITRHKTSTKIH